MKNFIFLFFALFLWLSSTAAISETKIIYPENQNPGILKYQWLDDSNNWHIAYSYDANYDLGQYNHFLGSNYRYETWRSVWTFNISEIPDGSDINSAKLSGSISGDEGYSGQLVALDWDLFSDPETEYVAVGNSHTIYINSINYNTFFEETVSALKDEIQQNLNNDVVKIGLLCIQETQDGSYGNLNQFQIEVDYTPPPVFYDITVKNSFEGGEVIVDGQNYASGTTFSWEENTQHTLEAFDQDWPDPNNYFRVFQNEWIKGTQTFTENPLTITVTENATYKAKFLRRFDFEVDNSFLGAGGGGQIKIDGQTETAPYFTHIIENNTIEVEAITPLTKSLNGRDVNYNFLSWSDGSTTNPLNITPTDHTNITANFKGHMVSFTSGGKATAFNNSRRMIRDNSGTWHLVYEDNGSIYYTKSTGDYSHDWDKETLVANGKEPAA